MIPQPLPRLPELRKILSQVLGPLDRRTRSPESSTARSSALRPTQIRPEGSVVAAWWQVEVRRPQPGTSGSRVERPDGRSARCLWHRTVAESSVENPHMRIDGPAMWAMLGPLTILNTSSLPLTTKTPRTRAVRSARQSIERRALLLVCRCRHVQDASLHARVDIPADATAHRIPAGDPRQQRRQYGRCRGNESWCVDAGRIRDPPGAERRRSGSGTLDALGYTAVSEEPLWIDYDGARSSNQTPDRERPDGLASSATSDSRAQLAAMTVRSGAASSARGGPADRSGRRSRTACCSGSCVGSGCSPQLVVGGLP